MVSLSSKRRLSRRLTAVVGPVWMFRITFAVQKGEKSYKKDRFVDLGAKTEANAHAWKREIEASIDSIREYAEFRQDFTSKADIGEPPAAVKKLLGTDDDALSTSLVIVQISV